MSGSHLPPTFAADTVPIMSEQNDRHNAAVYNLRLGHALGLLGVRTSDGPVLDEGQILVDGKPLLNMGNCSYLGLGSDLRLKAAAIAAVKRAGTSFASSPAYVALDMYERLRDRLERIFEHRVQIGASTTLTHLGTLPALVTSDDLVLYDRQAHASLQLAVQVVAARGTPVVQLRHNNVAQLADQLRTAAPDIKHIWYVADSVYSMYGDTAPFGDVRELQETHHRLWVYYDDAHGTSWRGRHGRGVVLETIGAHPRQIVVASLNKSFSASGGAVMLPNEELSELVLLTGPTFTFSGPIPPAGLGAAIASADLHLSDERDALEQRLFELFDVVRAVADEQELTLVDRSDTPVWFVKVGNTENLGALSWMLLQEGYFQNAATYPVVPRNAGGIRFNTTLYHTADEIAEFLRTLARLGHDNNLID